VGTAALGRPASEARAKPAYDYDPHLDPQLVWAGKKEHTSFEVHTASLHVHERIRYNSPGKKRAR
jgi:adenine-specific DNA-methyltransferase